MLANGTGQSACTVLVIDEDPQIGRLLRTALNGLDYAVITSTRAEEGMLLAARHRPDLVVMEARFRNTDGVELAGKILRAPGTSGAVVSILTADPSFHQRLRALQVGVSDYLRKPLAAPVLRQRVDAVRRVARSVPPRAQPSAAAQRLADVVRRIEERGASGTLHLQGPRGAASLAFSAGNLHVAQLGSLTGLHAFDGIARGGDWELRYDGDALGIDPAAPADELAPLPLYDEPSGAEISADELTVLDPALELRFTQSAAESHAEVVISGLAPLSTGEVPTDPQYQTRPQRVAPAVVATDEQTTAAEEAAAPRARPGPAAEGRAPASATGPIGARQEAAEGRGGTGAVDHAAIAAWLVDAQPGPLLVALADAGARDAARAAAVAHGMQVLCAASAAEAYQLARRAHPCAMLADTAFPDADGRELLGAVRADFAIRELTVILCSSAAVHALRAEGKPLDAILAGLDRALAPHVRLWEVLGEDQPAEGNVEPVGLASVMQMLGAQRFSGRLEVRAGDVRNAEVVFDQGNLCGVVVNAPQSSVGPLAMLNLIGYEWSRFAVLPGAIGAAIPLGDLRAMIDAAARQNNTLLRRAFDEGLKAQDLVVDRASLDAYLRAMPASSLGVLLRLADGEVAAAIGTAGEVAVPALKALLADMRRKAVIRVQSLKSLRVEEGDLAGVPQALPAAQQPAPRSRRWIVVALSTLATVAVASAGYLAYRHLYGG